ncbi:MAG TPA: OsmC family protein [Anaerolineae bacterium]|jgi:uncharacterized OsmC-like protein|nr:OsmC family protein [Anaerolineae bacterium]
MTTKVANINKGIDVEPLLAFKDMVREDHTKADRNPTVVAEWVGGDQSKIKMDGIETYLGGEGYLNPMKMLLACLAACDVDLIAMHASFLGLKIKNLAVEASGPFNVQSYLGFEDVPGSGYDGIAYTVWINAPDATQEQIDYLIERCERSSPVGDTLSRPVPLKLEFVANP